MEVKNDGIINLNRYCRCYRHCLFWNNGHIGAWVRNNLYSIGRGVNCWERPLTDRFGRGSPTHPRHWARYTVSWSPVLCSVSGSNKGHNEMVKWTTITFKQLAAQKNLRMDASYWIKQKEKNEKNNNRAAGIKRPAEKLHRGSISKHAAMAKVHKV